MLIMRRTYVKTLRQVALLMVADNFWRELDGCCRLRRRRRRERVPDSSERATWEKWRRRSRSSRTARDRASLHDDHYHNDPNDVATTVRGSLARFVRTQLYLCLPEHIFGLEPLAIQRYTHCFTLSDAVTRIPITSHCNSSCSY